MADWFSWDRSVQPGVPSASGQMPLLDGDPRFGGVLSSSQPPLPDDDPRFGGPFAGPTPAMGPYNQLNPSVRADYERARGILSMEPVNPSLLSYAPPATQTPAQAAIANVAPQKADPAAPIGMSPREYAAAQEARAAGTGRGGFMGASNPALRDWGANSKGLLGALGGGLLGGALLGPIGAAAGGLLGKSAFNGPMADYYPSAPAPIAGMGQGPGYGYDGLSDYGKSAYDQSQNFRDAVDSRSVGLW